MDIERFKQHVANGLKAIEHARENPISCDLDAVINDEKNFVASLYLKHHGDWDKLDQMFAESYFKYFLSQIVKIEVHG